MLESKGSLQGNRRHDGWRPVGAALLRRNERTATPGRPGRWAGRGAGPSEPSRARNLHKSAGRPTATRGPGSSRPKVGMRALFFRSESPPPPQEMATVTSSGGVEAWVTHCWGSVGAAGQAGEVWNRSLPCDHKPVTLATHRYNETDDVSLLVLEGAFGTPFKLLAGFAT